MIRLLIFIIMLVVSVMLLTACATPGAATSHGGMVLSPSEIVAVGGVIGVKPRSWLAGRCPQFHYTADAIPNESGVGFGVCFIPRLPIVATHNFRFTVTRLPGGTWRSPIGESVKVHESILQCFNGALCFGGVIPDQHDFVPGIWIIEVYRIDVKILEYRFTVKAHEEHALPQTSAAHALRARSGIVENTQNSSALAFYQRDRHASAG